MTGITLDQQDVFAVDSDENMEEECDEEGGDEEESEEEAVDSRRMDQ